jgi:MFS family permease
VEHLDQKKKITIMIAIMSAMLFAALNQTIVSTALPRIIAELGGEDYLSWVFTVYMLAATVTAVLVGKLSDIYGRKPFILIGLIVFIIGSFLAGLSNTIYELIVYRGIQGLGGGIIMSTAFTAVGDLFAPRERGRWQGLMSAVLV